MAAKQNHLFPEINPALSGNGLRRKRLVLPKELRSAAKDNRLDVGNAHAILVKWAELESSGKLHKKNESKMKGEFLSDVFGGALGYTLFSENLPQWQIEPEFSVNGGTADAAIGSFSQDANPPPRAIVEIKGPKIDLDRHRSQGRTPVQQCWDYLYAIPTCPWGIVCNYVSFRLYHRDKTPRAYEIFTLQELREVDKFREFFVLFSSSGLLPSVLRQKPHADILLERSETEQKEVGDKLYRDYHEQRLSLIQMLTKKPYKRSLDDSIRIAQKILDRIIFIAFCEDRDLLPEDTILRAWRDIQPFTKATNPRWENFKQLFRSVNEGNEARGITGYNGGLFRKDPDVDELDIGDDSTDFFKEIGTYDFKDVVNVDVLGHLFEQSVTDLEAIRHNPDILKRDRVPKSIGRRRREGIYYTPAHITRYIVENTIGRLLEKRYGEAAHRHKIDPTAEPTEKNLADWIKYNEARLRILKALRICDPACGSGAFLIQAYDFLEEAYDEVVTALCLRQGPGNRKLYDDISGHILRENLFGVDLSDEAVEITQLALWIRTARRGRSLSDLSENIQCGNSLVDNPKVDARAFDWHAKFDRVMSEGGFDCVIGNPPYIKFQNFRKREPATAEFLLEHYRSATGNFDMYLPFIERGLDLLHPEGRMGFIAPNVWLFNEYGRGLRELVSERGAMERFVDFKSHQIFDDATTYTALQFFGGQPHDLIEVSNAAHGDLKRLQFFTVQRRGLSGTPWALLEDRDQSILDKMREGSVTLAEASEQIFQGLITSADSIYHVLWLGPGRYYSHELKKEIELEDEICKALVSGEDAVPFATPPTEKYLIFPYFVTSKECRLLTKREMSKKFRRAWEYLKKNEKRLRAREGSKFDDDMWWRFGRPQNIDKQEFSKIGVPQTVNRLEAFIDPRGERYFNNVRVNGILCRKDKRFSLWYLLALMNSKALDYFFKRIAKPKDRDYFEANKQFIAPLPIPETKSQKALSDLAKKLANLHARRLKASAGVHRRFITDLPPAKLIETSVLPPPLTNRLRDFDENPFADLIRDMEKLAERKFKPAERGEWDEYLSKQYKSISSIKRSIDDLMTELNERVFRLYGLSKDDVKTIEETTTA